MNCKYFHEGCVFAGSHPEPGLSGARMSSGMADNSINAETDYIRNSLNWEQVESHKFDFRKLIVFETIVAFHNLAEKLARNDLVMILLHSYDRFDDDSFLSRLLHTTIKHVP